MNRSCQRQTQVLDLDDRARVIFIVREMEGVPCGSEIDDLADDSFALILAIQLIKNESATLPFGKRLAGRRIATLKKFPN